MAKKEIPPCIGFYDRGDTVCDGDPEGATENDQKACAWRDRCGAFKVHLERSGGDVNDYVSFPDEDHAEVEDFDKFEKFCSALAKKFGIAEGLPPEDEPEGEDNEDDDDEEEVEEEIDDEGEDDASTDDDEEEVDDEGEDDLEDDEDDEDDEGEDDLVDSELDGDDGDGEDDVSNDDGELQDDDDEGTPADDASTDSSSVEAKSRKPARRGKPNAPKGERATNSKWAAEQRDEALTVYRHFEDAIAEALDDWGFVKPNQAVVPGQLYVANRLGRSNYFAIYCKTATGRDIPIANAKIKARASGVDIDIPVDVKAFTAKAGKRNAKKLDVKSVNGGKFKTRITGADKERAAIVAETIRKLVEADSIKLPDPL